MDSYEQLIWVILFGNQQLVEKVTPWTEAKDRLFLPRDALPEPYEKVIPDHEPLLKYLQSRFYPDDNLLSIAHKCMDLYSAIQQRNQPKSKHSSASHLDWDRFANSERVKKIIEPVNLSVIFYGPSNQMQGPENQIGAKNK